MPHRLTLGLYNSYDPKSFHEAMRRAIARAAPLAAAFDFHLALFGFPFDAYETSSGERPKPRTPLEVAAVIAQSTSIGEGGTYLKALASAGALHIFEFPDRGFPPQLGTPVLATAKPDPKKKLDARQIVDRLEREPLVALVGLGPRGVPKALHALCPIHLELTGKSYSLETATALGVLAGRIAEARRRA